MQTPLHQSQRTQTLGVGSIHTQDPGNMTTQLTDSDFGEDDLLVHYGASDFDHQIWRTTGVTQDQVQQNQNYQQSSQQQQYAWGEEQQQKLWLAQRSATGNFVHPAWTWSEDQDSQGRHRQRTTMPKRTFTICVIVGSVVVVVILACVIIAVVCCCSCTHHLHCCNVNETGDHDGRSQTEQWQKGAQTEDSGVDKNSQDDKENSSTNDTSDVIVPQPQPQPQPQPWPTPSPDQQNDSNANDQSGNNNININNDMNSNTNKKNDVDMLIWHLNNWTGSPSTFPWDINGDLKIGTFAVGLWPTFWATQKYSMLEPTLGKATGGIMGAVEWYKVSKAYADKVGAKLEVWLLPQVEIIMDPKNAGDIATGFNQQIVALEELLNDSNSGIKDSVKVVGILGEREAKFGMIGGKGAIPIDQLVAVLKSDWLLQEPPKNSTWQFDKLTQIIKNTSSTTKRTLLTLGSYLAAPVQSYKTPDITVDPNGTSTKNAQQQLNPKMPLVKADWNWPDSYEPAANGTFGDLPKQYPTLYNNTTYKGFPKGKYAAWNYSKTDCNSLTTSCPEGCGCMSPSIYGQLMAEASVKKYPISPSTSKDSNNYIIALGGGGANLAVQGSCGVPGLYPGGGVPGCQNKGVGDLKPLKTALEGIKKSTKGYQWYLNNNPLGTGIALYG